MSVGTVIRCSGMLATPSRWLCAIFQSGLARVIVDVSTRPSMFLAAIAPSAAEKVPMLVPTSQTGTAASFFRCAATAPISPAWALPMRKMPFIPFCWSDGASMTATMRLWAANLSRVRTRKLPLPHFIAEAPCKPSAPWPPANRMTEATGLSGLIRMKACLTPRGV